MRFKNEWPQSSLTSHWLSLVVLALLLSACASSGAPPIESREPPPSRRINQHEVQQGETLYSIAWRYEADYRKMARINGLREPYSLAAGQRLKIYDDGTPIASAAAAPISERVSTGSSAVRTAPVQVGSGAATVSQPNAPSSASATTANPPIPRVPANVEGWQWPVSGRVTAAFGNTAQTNGIVIDPGTNTQVNAAADGLVVYAGTGIRGVGNLIIIKHTELFLSAYAYNSALLAKEGDQVRLGQEIAKVGKNAEGATRVYFEIRKDGNPVDPIGYLPQR